MSDEIECPFCRASLARSPRIFTTQSEPGDQVFVQDCEVLLRRPWAVTVHVGYDGEVTFDVGRRGRTRSTL